MQAPPNRIRVVIADDYSIFRNGLISSLSEEPQIAIVDQASNGKELIDSVEKHKPDIVLTDIRMPVLDGIRAASIILKEFPSTGIIGLSMSDDTETIKQMLSAGAKGYVLKTAESKEIITAIITVHSKENYYCSNTISKMIYFSLTKEKINESPEFSEKEIKIIELICQQKSSKEIASKLDSTIRSVESAKERILHKTGAKNVVGIALYAVAKMIVSLNQIRDLFISS